MMTIKINNGMVATWHVGEQCKIGYDLVEDVTEVQLDGHELEYVQRIWQDKLPNKRVVRLFGDMARNIVGNL